MRESPTIEVIDAPRSVLEVDHEEVLITQTSNELLRRLCDNLVKPVSAALNTKEVLWAEAGLTGRNAMKAALRALPERSSEAGVLTRDHIRLGIGDLSTFTALIAALARPYFNLADRLDRMDELLLTEVKNFRNRMNRVILHTCSLRELSQDDREAVLRSQYLGKADAIAQVFPPFDGQDMYRNLDRVADHLDHVSLRAPTRTEERIIVADDLGSVCERRLIFS